METFIRKDMRGNWKAETEIKLEGSMLLTLRTSRNCSGELVTHASVGTTDGKFVTHVMYSDYSQWQMRKKYPRITSKIVEEQHAEVLKTLDRIKSDIAKFYADKANKTEKETENGS